MMKYNRLVVFGDSLQDTGNLMKNTHFPLEPFYQGRFTNGKVASEYLVDFMSKNQNQDVSFENYAIGGALTTTRNPKAILRRYAFPVDAQLDFFKSKHGRFQEHDWVMINGGANNLLFTIHNEYPFFNIKPAFFIAKDLYKIAQKSIINGARNLVIWNIPDVTVSPAYRHAPYPKLITKVIKKYTKWQANRQNIKLKYYIDHLSIKYPHVKVQLFDFHGLLNQLLESPMAYGYENATEICVDSFGGVDSKGNIQKNIKLINKPDSYLFWDYVHPTTKGHKLLAEHIFSQFNQL